MPRRYGSQDDSIIQDLFKRDSQAEDEKEVELKVYRRSTKEGKRWEKSIAGRYRL
jgi:hypothetical protein